MGKKEGLKDRVKLMNSDNARIFLNPQENYRFILDLLNGLLFIY